LLKSQTQKCFEYLISRHHQKSIQQRWKSIDRESWQTELTVTCASSLSFAVWTTKHRTRAGVFACSVTSLMRVRLTGLLYYYGLDHWESHKRATVNLFSFSFPLH
jgi:hypothetical protein